MQGAFQHGYWLKAVNTNNRAVWQFVNRFTEYYDYQHRVLSYVQGRLIPFPINRDTLEQLFCVNMSSQEVLEFLAQEVEKSQYNSPPKNFRDAVVAQVGQRLYELFYKNYREFRSMVTLKWFRIYWIIPILLCYWVKIISG